MYGRDLLKDKFKSYENSELINKKNQKKEKK